MAGGAAKRSSDDGLVTEGKKKKISKDKRESLVGKEKLSSNCNGDSKQKKAFFAYFGKTLDSKTEKSTGTVMIDLDNDNSDLSNSIDCNADLPPSKKKKKIIDRKLIKSSSFVNICALERNDNLTYNSYFYEKLSCFPKITHANWSLVQNVSDDVLNLRDTVLHDNVVRSTNLVFTTLGSNIEGLTLEPYQTSIDVPYMVKSLKNSIPDLAISDMYKQLKKKRVLTHKNSNKDEDMWVDKYKPACCAEVLGNNMLVKDLKRWLESYRKNSNYKLTTSSNYDDLIDDSDSNSSQKVPLNLAILSGPSGCGKTAAVYAAAKELDANIIELNASCNRNGKRILTDLIEATQSHAVKKNIFSMVKEKKRKVKNVKKQEDKKEKMSIILIEDADIFFDNYDDGFLSAISTLGRDSKRPLILVVNDPFSNHLTKFFFSNEITLSFDYPPKKHLKGLLHLIALTEGAILTEKEIDSLVHPFKPDIRQSLLQLQYIIKSGELVQSTPKPTYERNIDSLWWNWPTLNGNVVSNSGEDEKNNFTKNISTLSQYLDTLSQMNIIYSKTQNYGFLDPQPFWYHLTTRDSATLCTSNHSPVNANELSIEITQWVHDKINNQNAVHELQYPSSDILCSRQKIWEISKDILNQIGLENCNRKNQTSFDYLATIRSMSRMQGSSQPSGNLRHTKYFSYLKRLGIDVNNMELKNLCDSLCSSSNYDKPVVVSDQF
ncbi:uncharacterized protein LOC126842239 [Adelges cooleyi]|uniref:uncharacterized protein LOC126842239 n=1 Tax=Adelges cooleyi TaxID=133065 RepID=UPI00218073E0|nr:uncharacterized protein LOC126842239 [Adelges cooleyi]